MRFWLSGPRLFGGAFRPGVSFGPEDLKTRRPIVRACVVGNEISSDFVYVIVGTMDLVKIGISNNPPARMAALQTGSPHPLNLAFSVPAYGNAYAIEQEAHRILDVYRAGGEWFGVTPEMAIAAIYAAADRLGCSMTSESSPAPKPSVKIWPESLLGQIFFIFVVLYVLGILQKHFGL